MNSSNNLTLEQKIDEILVESIQITDLGSFPDTKPPEHRRWFTTNGRLFVLDFTVAKQQLLSLIESEKSKAFMDGWHKGRYDANHPETITEYK